MIEEEKCRIRREEERKRKAEEQEWKKKGSMGELFGNDDHVEYYCPHCGFEVKVNETLALQLFYCKRCREVQTQPTKQVVETVRDKERRGFWQSTVRREVHADIIAYKPVCYSCKRSDMMVPFEKKHCPVCGAVLLT